MAQAKPLLESLATAPATAMTEAMTMEIAET